MTKKLGPQNPAESMKDQADHDFLIDSLELFMRGR